MERAAPAKGIPFHHKLNPVLSPQEELVWAGQPPQGIRFQSTDMVLIPLSFIWGGIIMGSIFGALGRGGFGFNPLSFLVLFLFLYLALLAMYITGGRFLIEAYHRAYTFYGITNRRIIVLNNAIGGKTSSYDLKSLVCVYTEKKRNGRGTICIEPAPMTLLQIRSFKIQLPSTVVPILEELPDAQQVYEMLQDIRDYERE